MDFLIFKKREVRIMTNDLRIMKKELKSFAKRVKNFKYTDSACITFLLTGLIMLSGISFNLYSDEIKTQQEAINTSIFKLQKDFRLQGRKTINF